MKKKFAKCILNLLTFSTVISAGVVVFGGNASAEAYHLQYPLIMTDGECYFTDSDEGGSSDWFTDGDEGGSSGWLTDGEEGITNGEEGGSSSDDFLTDAEENALSINELNFPDPVFRTYVKNTFDVSKDNRLSLSEIKDAVSIDVANGAAGSADGGEWITDAEDGSSSDQWITGVEEWKASPDQWITDAEDGSSSDQWITDAEDGSSSDTQEKISDLTGIQHFIYLETLNCSGNLLTTLDVSQNAALTELNCADNRLAALDLSCNRALTRLNISDNQFKTLNLSMLSGLEHLKVDGNQMVALDVSNSKSLRAFSGKQDEIAYTGTTMDLTNYDTSFDVSRVSGRKGILFKGNTPVFKKGFYHASYSYEVSPGHRMTVQIIRKKSAAEQKWGFTDLNVVKGNWKYESVKYISEEGIMGAVGGSTFFQPDHPLSRAMLATILYRMAGEPAFTAKNTFPDVEEGSWYHDAVCWARGEGIINGYPNGIFGTNDMVTREQTAKMLYLYAEYEGYPVDARKPIAGYLDVKTVSVWASDYIQWCSSQQIISGKPTDDGGMKIDPQGNTTRAECSKMIKLFLQNVAGAR